MKKTYRCSNVKFCMEDDNQRRAWEYLQGITRKDGSYGKILSDALVMVLDASKKQESNLQDEPQIIVVEITRTILEGVRELLAEKTLISGDCEVRNNEQTPEQGHEEKMSEDMMNFAFAMGE